MGGKLKRNSVHPFELRAVESVIRTIIFFFLYLHSRDQKKNSHRMQNSERGGGKELLQSRN